METLHQTQPDLGQENVKVFLRINSSKKGSDFQCPSVLTESYLVENILSVINSNRFLKKQCSQFIDKAAFVIEGRRIDSRSSEIISLRPNTIIHLVDEQETLKEEIKVTFRYQNPQQNQDVSHEMQVKIDSIIETEVQKIAPLNFNKFVHELTFVYLGADLSPLKTFKQANVEDNAEIIFIEKLRNQRDEVDPFANAQELPVEVFCFQPTRIEVKKKDSIQNNALNMPFNPVIQAKKVKLLLEQNVRETQLFIQQQQRSALTVHNTLNESIQQEAPQLIQSEVEQERMNSENEIGTKEEIQAYNRGQKMQEEPSNQQTLDSESNNNLRP